MGKVYSMTIKYLDSKRISALAADTKPTNVETNSILVEKDTGARKWFDGTNWNPSWDLNEDFTGCTTNQCDGLWASSDTGAIYVDTGSNWIHWIGSRGTNDHIAYNLNTLLGGDVDNNAFVFRCSAKWNNVSSSATNEQRIGIGNLPQTSAHNATWILLVGG